MEILEVMNVIMELPIDTVRLVCDADYADQSGRHTARAIFRVRDLYIAYRDFILNSEGYWKDHLGLLGQEPNGIPVIIPVPELAFSMKVTVTETGGDWELGSKKLSEHSFYLNRGDIRKLREDFLKYMPDGDHYNDTFVLTEKGRQEVERMLYEDEET